MAAEADTEILAVKKETMIVADAPNNQSTLMCSGTLEEFYKDNVLQQNIRIIDGRFGNVTVWRNRASQQLLVKKQINRKNFEEIEPRVHRLMAGNRCFITLYSEFSTLRDKILVMEYIPHGDLFDLVKQKSRLSERRTVSFLKQIVQGLIALHNYKIVHNDIKLENILIRSETEICICDYGLCKEVGEKGCDDGTLDYFSPEKLENINYGVHFDWWAVGVLTHEMLTGGHPFKAYSDEELTPSKLKKRYRGGIYYRHKVSKLAHKFIFQVLAPNFMLRYKDGERIKGHIFLNQ